MNIGIITWYKGPNYGTNLQAIALQWFLRNSGHNVQIINYNDSLISYSSHRTLKKRILSQPDKLAKKIAIRKYGGIIDKKNSKMRSTIKQKCVLTEIANNYEEFINICNSFELLIVGSDQLWNPSWYSPIYYADFEKVKTRRISYAPSLGVKTIPENLLNVMHHGLSRFSHISVREAQGKDILKKELGVDSCVVVDPTLLLSQNDWLSIFPKKESSINDEYVLSVFLSDNFFHWKAANIFSKNEVLQHVIVPYMGFSFFQKGTVCVDTDLSDLLNLIRGAKYILTDSFHITVFSIIMQKQFYTFERFKEKESFSTNSRVKNLLSKLNLNNRVQHYNCVTVLETERIDYKNVSKLLDKEISKSKQYLYNAILDN